MRLVILTLLILSCPVFAQDDLSEIDLARKAASDRLLTELEELAAWSDEMELFLGRDTCYELLIQLAPSHPGARRGLKYSLKNGKWVQRSYRRPSNRNPDMEPLFAPRLTKAVSDYTDTILELIESRADELEYAKKLELVADVLGVDPDNRRARAANGEAQQKGKWVLVETVAADRRRSELKIGAKEALAEIPDPKLIEATAAEQKLGVTWKPGYQGEWWRGLGTVSGKELEKTLKMMEVSNIVFGLAFGMEVGRPRGCGFYLLKSKKQAEKVLNAHPAFSDDQRKYYIKLSAAWIPGRQVFFDWSDHSEVRRDTSVRMAMGILKIRTFAITTERGWVWEGLGVYLGELVTGTRRTVFVTRDIRTTTERERAFDIERRMKEPGSNWVRLAHELVSAGLAPEIPAMTRKVVNDLTPMELVVSYALTRFIIEGTPEQARHFYSAHGNHGKIEETVEKVYGIPYNAWENRFRRWLDEMN